MGSTWLTDLPAAARASGLPVWVSPGFERRGHGGLAGPPRGVLCHHMGTTSANGWTVVQNGRADLAGPLAQLSLERDGSVRVLAAGCCWHAGTGGPFRNVPRNNGNDWLIGIEECSNGGDRTAAQRDAYPRLVAALLDHYRLPREAFTFHRLWAPNRKVDPGGWDFADFAARVRGAGAAAPASPATHDEEFLMALSDAEQRELLGILRELRGQVTGDVDGSGPDGYGWPTVRGELTPVDMLRFLVAQLSYGAAGVRSAGEIPAALYDIQQRLARLEAATGKNGA